MKGKKIIFPLVAAYAAVILTCCTGRTSGAKQCNPVAFPMVKTPTYIIDQEQAVRFLAKNFWDDFFKIQHPCTEVSTAVHGVDSISFLKAFGMYAQLAFSQSEADCAKGGVGAGQTVEHSVAELIANMDSLALKGDRKPLLRVMELVEHYFYDPNSPVLNEEIYLCALNGIMAAKSLSDLDKCSTSTNK